MVMVVVSGYALRANPTYPTYPTYSTYIAM